VRKAKLLSTVAAALLLTAGAASAQMIKETPERAPAAQQNAPAEKMAPSLKDQQKSPPDDWAGDAGLKVNHWAGAQVRC
jgi:uncharacterized lipoprotein YajG